MVIEHIEQVIFCTSRTAVCGVAASADTGRQIRRAARSLLTVGFLSSIEKRQNPRTGDKTERYRYQYPEDDSLCVSRAVRNTVIFLRAALRDEIQLPKSESKEQNRQCDEDRAVRFESSQVTDPRASDTQAQE